MMIPKCVGSMPCEAAIGINIGARIRMADPMSIRQPISIRKRLMVSKAVTGLSILSLIHATKFCGTSSYVRNTFKLKAIIRTGKSDPSNFVVSLMTSLKSSKFISLWISDSTMKAYTTATAADSVAVKYPV